MVVVVVSIRLVIITLAFVGLSHALARAGKANCDGVSESLGIALSLSHLGCRHPC